MTLRIGESAGANRDSVRGMLREICPEADMQVADDGAITTNPPDFCTRRRETPLSLGCQCMCDLIASGRTMTIRVREDLSAFGGGRTTAANDDNSVNGTGSDQTVEIENQQTIRESAHLAQQGSAKALVENVEKVGKGDTKGKIERILGRAGSLNEREWVYYLDEYSGYAINFDGRDRVESVNSWRA